MTPPGGALCPENGGNCTPGWEIAGGSDRLDPLEDTETLSGGTHRRFFGVPTVSIRLRILKRVHFYMARGLLHVPTVSIRLRILKRARPPLTIAPPQRSDRLDPLEDTETTGTHQFMPTLDGSDRLDPLEDTETSSDTYPRQHSIPSSDRLDPLEDTETLGLASMEHGCRVPTVSIRLRILKLLSRTKRLMMQRGSDRLDPLEDTETTTK